VCFRAPSAVDARTAGNGTVAGPPIAPFSSPGRRLVEFFRRRHVCRTETATLKAAGFTAHVRTQTPVFRSGGGGFCFSPERPLWNRFYSIMTERSDPIVLTSNLGYPRIGFRREWKKTLESYWQGTCAKEAFEADMKTVRLACLEAQKRAGIDWIPVGDFSLYDHVLDAADLFGIVPERFDRIADPLARYFAMARGADDAPACEMTKWFNTNYHYIVPEWTGRAPRLRHLRPIDLWREAKAELGIDGKIVLVGPYTFVRLAKGYEARAFGDVLAAMTEAYAELLAEAAKAGVVRVQLDEPSLVTDVPADHWPLVARSYDRLAAAAPGLFLIVQTYFGAPADERAYRSIVALPVQAVGLDFVHGRVKNIAYLEQYGFPADKHLAAGVVDGRNIWRTDIEDRLALLARLTERVPADRLVVQPSCSLLHVPIRAAAETSLPPALRDMLAFADEKLAEVRLIADIAAGRQPADPHVSAYREAAAALERLRAEQAETGPARESTPPSAAAEPEPDRRPQSYAERLPLQQAKWKLPPLPTTTIGSLPQTAEVRRARFLYRKGEWSREQYRAFLEQQMREWIRIQEDIGLDVLVHGEFERNDMVEYFAEQLGGFAFTANGWVQSYGSRCVKPPIIYADVRFLHPMTVEEARFAQSLTDKPVKGMLTGPVTILNWSFVREDIPRREVAFQIARALRREIEELERAGIEMIQVDEPALREGLPLVKEEWGEYLDWAVRAFRIATATVRPTTQIHTHMCYAEFHDILDAIEALDADVLSIEASRSRGELFDALRERPYSKAIGPGVYDVHSPRVPPADEMLAIIRRALETVPADRCWVNPDCGLKTRGREETIAALREMVAAARRARSEMTAE